jgi:ribonuclease P protein component
VESPERLKRRADFDRVFRRGVAVTGRLVVVRAVRGGGAKTRVGFAVGRQIGGAVVRNRLRRRWREIVRLGPPLATGWDVVVVARAAGERAAFQALALAWRDVLRRSGLEDVSGGAARVPRRGVGRT